MYTKAFVEIYNWSNRRQVHKTCEMVKCEKYLILKTKNALNLSAYWFFKISRVSYNAHIEPKDTYNNIFYNNNYIDLDKFNQLYNPG